MSERYFCRICKTEITPKNRVKSHLLNRSINWSGGDLYTVSKTGEIIDAKKQARQQNLFCLQCEQKFKQWEDESLRLFSDQNNRPTKSPSEQPAIMCYGYNNEYIVLTCLTEVLRCSICNHPLYSDITLTDEQMQRIVKIISSSKINDFSEYPVVLARFNDCNITMDRATHPPIKITFPCGVIPPHGVYYLCKPLRGWIWLLKIDKKPYPSLDRISIPSTGGITILNFGDIAQTPFATPILKKHK